MSEALTKARCAVCSWPLFVHPGRVPCDAPTLHLPIAGVRVAGDKVIVAVRGGNDAARFVCGALIAMLPINQERGQASALSEKPLTQAASDLLAERQRQVRTEGWTPEHDDEHDDYEMAKAAAAYALYAGGCARRQAEGIWPWDLKWFKPHEDDSTTNRRRELVKAGALILAELERIDRAAAPAAPAAIATPGLGETCSYPDCQCPFDAPSDPNWCARGRPKKPRVSLPRSAS